MGDGGEKQRLFFALWPDEQQQGRWAQAAGAWLLPVGGQLVNADNIHLTLLFAGEVAMAQRQCLEQMADTVHGESFSLRIDRSGYWRRPQVAWWGCSEAPLALLDLVSALRAGGKQCGIKVDERPYVAHLTMARNVNRPPLLIEPEMADWQVDHFVLVRSRRSPRGVVYEVQRRWALA